MINALRMQMNADYRFSNTCLRGVGVLGMLRFRRFICDRFEAMLRLDYSTIRMVLPNGNLVRGPLSFKCYLENMMQAGFWGDIPFLFALVLVWGVRITIVYEHLREHRILHDAELVDVDFRLFFNSVDHYSVIGGFCFPLLLTPRRRQSFDDFLGVVVCF